MTDKRISTRYQFCRQFRARRLVAYGLTPVRLFQSGVLARKTRKICAFLSRTVWFFRRSQSGDKVTTGRPTSINPKPYGAKFVSANGIVSTGATIPLKVRKTPIAKTTATAIQERHCV